MDTEDDEELRLVRASNSLLSDLEVSLPALLWKSTASNRVVHRHVRSRDLEYLLQLIEPFQGEPQLLDSKLKIFLPLLVDAYLAYLQLPRKVRSEVKHISLDVAVSKILYTFCKVRGEKIIAGFLNNEPRYLEPILLALEEQSEIQADQTSCWEVSFILLTWLSHLLLAPFDLASISVGGNRSQAILDLQLPELLPDVARRIIHLVLKYVPSVTREQDASTKLLVRLVKRPDMQRLNLPVSLVSWAIQQVESSLRNSSMPVNACIGPLRFLTGMAMTPDSPQTLELIPSIHSILAQMAGPNSSDVVTTSAVVKRLTIKISRSVAILSLQPASGKLASYFETNSPLEDAIDDLLQCLGDRDTKVRFAASKAMSMIVMRLDAELGHEVIQAVLDSFKEDVDMTQLKVTRDFTMVNPLKWHGLTLTLSHNLFRRSASPEQLSEIVNTLLLALTFEQRASTGNSIGTNVRDAACFGIWSLARRYTTAELLSVNTSSLERRHRQKNDMTIIQVVAIELLLAACLDPGGNVRRGCSAALQELIGRHPDQVSQGIPLVQAVDYQAVGLRQRAMIQVAQNAAALDMAYWHALLDGLLGWRGICAPDVHSRQAAAISLGTLSAQMPFTESERVLFDIRKRVELPLFSSVEDRHGALLAMAEMVHARLGVDGIERQKETKLHSSEAMESLLRLWQVFVTDVSHFVDFTPRGLKAEFSTAVALFITALARLSEAAGIDKIPLEIEQSISKIVHSMVNRSEEPVLEAIPALIQGLLTIQLHSPSHLEFVNIRTMLHDLPIDSSKLTMHGAGKAIAIGAAFPYEAASGVSREQVIEVLTAMLSVQEVEWRVLGLRAVQLVIPHLGDLYEVQQACMKHVLEALHKGLNDYTVTERGDVGSLVRIQAIRCVKDLWSFNVISKDSLEDQSLQAELFRLALEKLDRVRMLAARCLLSRNSTDSESLIDVSSHQYFFKSLLPLVDIESPAWTRVALVRGLASSAGTGNEALLQSARTALTETLLAGEPESITNVMKVILDINKELVVSAADTQPILELLGFMFDAVPLQTLVDENFSWRNLLSQVQKAHFKSSIIPKILAAVDVYRGLAQISSVRQEVLKKLLSMLKTNPYQRVRVAVAEVLWCVSTAETLKPVDWAKPPKQNTEATQELEKRLLK